MAARAGAPHLTPAIVSSGLADPSQDTSPWADISAASGSRTLPPYGFRVPFDIPSDGPEGNLLAVLMLVAFVLAFLSLQSRVDRADKALARAPLRVDVLPFG